MMAIWFLLNICTFSSYVEFLCQILALCLVVAYFDVPFVEFFIKIKTKKERLDPCQYISFKMLSCNNKCKSNYAFMCNLKDDSTHRTKFVDGESSSGLISTESLCLRPISIKISRSKLLISYSEVVHIKILVITLLLFIVSQGFLTVTLLCLTKRCHKIFVLFSFFEVWNVYFV